MKNITSILVHVLFLYALAWGVPFLVYVLLSLGGIDVTPGVYIVVVLSLFVTACALCLEMWASLHVRNFRKTIKLYPAASAIITAYLPNEIYTIVETVEAMLSMNYPGSLQIILAYNTPRVLAVEKKLQSIAKRDARLVLFQVPTSTSKAQNINAALSRVTGEFVGIFDADHLPDRNSFRRAWKWLARGYDVVQGHCVVRNGGHSLLTRAIAVEFEGIYAVSHPGRSVLHGYGIFGGSNGYWKTDILRGIGMNSDMLTEDIDASVRSLLAGHTIANDPRLISRELAPVSLTSLWNQRVRWAQGWFQVTLRYMGQGLRSKKLTLRQKIGLSYLLGWREIYPWISLQIPPLLAYWVWKYRGINHLNWFIPVFVAITVFTQLVTPMQIVVSYILADRKVRKHKMWFIWYTIFNVLLYATLKRVISLVAQLKELQNVREWNITARHSVVTIPSQV